MEMNAQINTSDKAEQEQINMDAQMFTNIKTEAREIATRLGVKEHDILNGVEKFSKFQADFETCEDEDEATQFALNYCQSAVEGLVKKQVEMVSVMEVLTKMVKDLKKENEELKEKMKFLDLNGKPCERCSEPVLYEGNEGKIDSYGDVVCGECFAREQYEKKCFPDEDEEADWECEYCEKDGFYNQEGMVEEAVNPNGDWSETYCWCNETCHQKWLKRQQKKQDNIHFASSRRFHITEWNDELNSANDELNSAIDASGNALY
jgi:hypothetical protein